LYRVFCDLYSSNAFGYSDNVRSWKLSEMGLTSSIEMLHPMGNVSDIIELGSHDSALRVQL
jgi:hypothetical protein